MWSERRGLGSGMVQVVISYGDGGWQSPSQYRPWYLGDRNKGSHHLHGRLNIGFGGRRADGRVTEFTCVHHEGVQRGPI